MVKPRLWSAGEVTDQGILVPDLLYPSTSDFLGKVGLNLSLGLVTSCYGYMDCMLEA